MNLKEALQALGDGKKIRRKGWPTENYIFIDNAEDGGSFISDETGRNAIYFAYGDDWEIYEEYHMDFVEALAWMMNSSLNVCKTNTGFFMMVMDNRFYCFLSTLKFPKFL